MRVGVRSARAGGARRRGVLGLAVGAWLFGCYSPTLPLPPPVSPDITVTESGEFLASGHVLENAQVFCVNSRNGAINGQWVGDDALYSFQLTGARFEDPMQIWYQVGTELSPTTFFTLPRRPAGSGGSGGSGGSANGGAGNTGGTLSGEAGASGAGP